MNKQPNNVNITVAGGFILPTFSGANGVYNLAEQHLDVRMNCGPGFAGKQPLWIRDEDLNYKELLQILGDISINQ